MNVLSLSNGTCLHSDPLSFFEGDEGETAAAAAGGAAADDDDWGLEEDEEEAA